MTNLDINTVINWKLEELYNYIKTIEEEITEEEQKTIKLIEEGSFKGALPVHINYIIKEYYTEYPQSEKVKIIGLGKAPIHEFWKDKDKRECELRKIIINNLKDESPTEERT